MIHEKIKFCWYLQDSLLSGISLDEALQKANPEFNNILSKYEKYKFSKSTAVRSYDVFLFDLISKGLEGYPILESLNTIEKYIFDQWNQKIDRYLKKLSLWAILPIFLLQFPLFLFLIFYPLLKELNFEYI